MCKRVIDKHRRDAVKEPIHVLKAIDARGGPSRIVKSGTPDGAVGELWLSGQAGIESNFFSKQNIKLCVTAAHGLQKRFKTFRKRRDKALKSNDAELIKLDWEDNPSQTIDWEKELRPTLEKMHSVIVDGGSVVVRHHVW